MCILANRINNVWCCTVLSSLYSNWWKEGLCCFGCLFKLQEFWSATPDSVWCLRLSGYFWTLQVDTFVLNAHLEHQLFLYWFALAFCFKLIRGTVIDHFVSFLTRKDSNLTDKTTSSPVQFTSVLFVHEWLLSLKAPHHTVPSGMATISNDIFTVSCTARSWWWPCCDMWAYISGIQPTDDSLVPILCSGGESA